MNPPWRVSCPEAVKKTLVELAKRATRKGLGEQFLEALKTVDEQLKVNPLAFGDPIRTLPHTKLLLMHRIVAPLVVYYAVRTEQPVVFVREFKPFPIDAF